jgi:Flp pilus assembly protein TadG
VASLRERAAGHHHAGQSLVEFTVMVVFLLVLLMGVFDLGRAYFSYLALKDAAAEGAYYGSAFPQCASASGLNSRNSVVTPACSGANNIPFRTIQSAPIGGLIDWAHATIQVANPVLAAGVPITVSVSYPYQLLTPIVGAIANSQYITLTARSSAIIVRVPYCESTTAFTCQ